MKNKNIPVNVSSCKVINTSNIVNISSVKAKEAICDNRKKEAIEKCIKYAETLDW